MRGSKYLSELITDPAHILTGKMNLIEANTSAGKTYFALNTLPQWAGTPEKVLYPLLYNNYTKNNSITQKDRLTEAIGYG